MNTFFDVDWNSLLQPTMSVAEAVLRGSAASVAIFGLAYFLQGRVRRPYAAPDAFPVAAGTVVAVLLSRGSLMNAAVILTTLLAWGLFLNYVSARGAVVHGLDPKSADRSRQKDIGGSETTNTQSPTALLLIDVINDLDFEGNDEIVRTAEAMADRIAALAARARAARVPVIYVNDNFGHWRSDFRATIEHCLHDSVPGRKLAEKLLPDETDYFVLKPRHSGFYSTTLETLLRHLEIDTLVLTGIAGNICVLFTAYDAFLRGYRVVVPTDCIASNSAAETATALSQMKKVLKADTLPADEVQFSPPTEANIRRKSVESNLIRH